MPNPRQASKLREADRAVKYKLACEGFRPDVKFNLAACRKRSDPHGCCRDLCACARLRDEHFLIAFAGNVTREDAGHAHMRAVAREACGKCHEDVQGWVAKQRLAARASTGGPKTPGSGARAPTATPRRGTASSASSFVSGNPFSAIAASPSTAGGSAARRMGSLGLQSTGSRERERGGSRGRDAAASEALKRRLDFQL